MLVVLAFHKGDRHLALGLAEWLRDLGAGKGHRLILLRDAGAEHILAFLEAFDQVTELVVSDDKWQKWPQSPNHSFGKAAKYIEYTDPEPWLWIEPDCVVMRQTSFSEIESEYHEAKKPFMGYYLAAIPDKMVAHMSGVGVYPGRMTQHAGLATIAMDLPWDIEAAHQIVPKMHRTKLIKHNWQRPEFTSLAEVRAAIGPEVALFHADKAGSVIKLLRENNNCCIHSSSEQSSGVDLSSNGALLTGERHLTSGVTAGETAPISKPWTSQLESIERIKHLSAELASYCTAPKRTWIVRQELAAAGVVPGAVKKRKRRK